MSVRRGSPLVILCLLAAAAVAEDVELAEVDALDEEDTEYSDEEAFENVDGAEEDEDGHPMDDPTPEDNELPPLTTDQLEKFHKTVDKNGDGKIGLAELMSFSTGLSGDIAVKDIADANLVNNVDKSKDGKVSLEEHMADFSSQFDGMDEEEKPTQQHLEERKQLETKKFKAADGNQDGFLDGHELVAFFRPETNEKVMTVAVEASMKEKDVDGDGKLSIHELWAPDVGSADVETDPDFTEMKNDFKHLDANGDGLLDTTELRRWESGEHATEGAMRTLLGIADANDDGEVTLEELTEAAEGLSSSDAQYYLDSWRTHNKI